MASILIYDENGNIVALLGSAHTPDYEGRSDVIINPDLPGDFNTLRYKVVNGALWRKDDAELITQQEAQKQHAINEALSSISLPAKDILQIILGLLPEFDVITLDQVSMVKQRFIEEAKKRLDA